MSDKPAKSDSADYGQTFYGILNAQGQFWTPLAFDSKEGAEAYLAGFISRNDERFASMRRTHKAVPVRVWLEAIKP